MLPLTHKRMHRLSVPLLSLPFACAVACSAPTGELDVQPPTTESSSVEAEPHTHADHAAEQASASSSIGDFDPEQHCGLLPPSVFAEAPPVPTRLEQAYENAPPRVRRIPPGPAQHSEGALLGKTVYVSAGHGFVWGAGEWGTQRSTTQSIIEDLVSAEATTQYLIPYLRNMGAYVVPLREPGFQPQRIEVDDADALSIGTFQEDTPSPSGWGALPLPLTGQANPFSAGTSRRLRAEAVASGSLVYPATIASSGSYDVFVAYRQGPDNAPDAHYVVSHAGGTSHVRVDQRRHGQTWVWLGAFWFEAGAPLERASVALHNDSATPGALLSADAVRFGSGMGMVDRGGGALNRPLWESASRYYAQTAGAPPAVYDSLAASYGDHGDDVGARPRFAAWDHEPGEDAVYVAWHTNAAGQRGTESFTYSPKGASGFGSQADFTGVAGSLELQNAVHRSLIGALRAEWEPGWIDRGKKTAYFGEINPSNNGEMPSMLIEVAFHDQPVEAAALREPQFRELASRSIAEGIAAYFAKRDNRPEPAPLPAPPRAVRVQNAGIGSLRVSWADDGHAHRVFVSDNGYGFDDGHITNGTSFVLDGLTPGSVRYVRVAAVNPTGQSFPSEVVGARSSVTGAASVLVVNGFDRLDAAMSPVDDLSAYGLAPAVRQRLWQMNDGSYAARHGAALAAAGFAFDGSSDEAVEEASVLLDGYRAIDWFCGEDSSGNEPFPASTRVALSFALRQGKGLLLSGSELAWALDAMGSDAERGFYRSLARGRYAFDDADSYVARGAASFSLLGEFRFDDGYDADYPDVLSADAGSQIVLEYPSGDAAGLAWRDGSAGAVVLGFPFEVVAGAPARAALMQASLEYLGVPREPDVAPVEPPVEPPAPIVPAPAETVRVEGEIEAEASLESGCAASHMSRGALPIPAVLLALALCWRRRARR